ncbi:Polyadenylate-binding protein RBP47 [Apostasia shenzhenica]|uniref:Polyadenylate-binding protein RBP47 n=1 Tax=Apostasia shenzhenica TaxID=1088818 RepID=A0A2I0B5Y6_9ASPA|nr:Polyadenylate-binding protein RBP47 [Apostasia shenzhenica]
MQQAAGGDQLQHPWVPAAARPYPVSTMVVPPHLSPQFPPHFFGFHQPRYPPPSPLYSAPQQMATGAKENKTIWVGDLLNWMDENYLHSCFGHTGEVVSIKVIRNKQTGKSEGYGFVEFFDHAAALKVIQTFNGLMMPNSDQHFRLNWASFSTGDRRSDIASDHSIFVGDLAPDVTDSLLQETFANKYSSVKGAKVVIDVTTGRSRGYGFVRFGDDNEKTLAMTEMNGVYCSNRAMRICAATPRKISGSSIASVQGFHPDANSANTTVFVGGLDASVSEDELKQVFSKFGEIASVKIPVGKQCGFVQFVQKNDAEMAMQALNGTVIGEQMVRLSWGRNPANKQLRLGPMYRWSGGYYGGQIYGGYSGYGYTVPYQHPGMYAAAYSPYSMYGFEQQVS